MTLPDVQHRHVELDGLRIFYRETGPRDAPALLLLHGFPSASHQFRRLFDALGDRYRLIAPDHPGFGQSDAPAPRSAGGSFEYGFDQLAARMSAWCERIALRRFTAYLFDFGAPIGFRIAAQHPEWFAGLVLQNANAYEEGPGRGARTRADLARRVDAGSVFSGAARAKADSGRARARLCEQRRALSGVASLAAAARAARADRLGPERRVLPGGGRAGLSP